MLKGKEHWLILGALALAVVLALVLRAIPESAFTVFMVESCRFLGALFKLALEMLIVPLIVTSVIAGIAGLGGMDGFCLLYTSPSPRDRQKSRMPSSA